jgi:hypothetical protein
MNAAFNPGLFSVTGLQALNVLQKCLRTFVEERMRSEYKDRWIEKARQRLSDFRASHTGSLNLDVQALIRIATDGQHQVLHNALSPESATSFMSYETFETGMPIKIFSKIEMSSVLSTLWNFFSKPLSHRKRQALRSCTDR